MNIWGGNILKRFSSSISRKMWSYLHIIKVVYCCRYFHLVNSVCICLIVSLIYLFLLLDVLVLFGSTTENGKCTLIFRSTLYLHIDICNSKYERKSHFLISVDSVDNVRQAKRYRVSSVQQYCLIQEWLRKSHLKIVPVILEFAFCNMRVSCAMHCASLLNLCYVLSSNLIVYSICFTYYMANIRYHHLLISVWELQLNQMI